MLRARCTSIALLVAVAACGSTKGGFTPPDGGRDGSDGALMPACPALCETAGFAVFDLACGPSDLSSVVLSGPCATGDANPASYVGGSGDRFVSLGSPSAGVCHVELQFANGFIYSADVTFTSQTLSGPPGCPSCAPFIGPTQSTFMVNNPSSTCGDGGSDAGADG